MPKPLIINLVWAGVAGAAFTTGYLIKSPGDGKDANASALRTIANAPSGDGATQKKGPAVIVSRDSAVLDFYKRYGLDTGTPISAEKMKEAMLEAIRESDPVKSQLMFARLMEELTPENAPAALAMIRENVSGMESMRYMGTLAYKWGQVDPLTAMKELAKGDERSGRMSQNVVLTGWAATDPKAAMEWLNAYEGEGKDWLGMSIVNGMAKSDPEGALKYVSGLENKDDRTRGAETIAREMIRLGGAEKAVAWLNGLTDPDMKSGAFRTIAEQMMRGDTDKAAEWIKTYAGEDYARDAVRNLSETLARKDPQEALKFANDLTGKAQSSAINQAVNEWVRQNDGAGMADAAKYVESLPAGDNRDAGAQAIARQAVREDPQAAIAWANSIKNTEERADTLVDVARRYMFQDRDAAEAWLATSGLSAEDQQRVTNPARGDWGGGRGTGAAGGGRGGPPGGFGGGGGGRGGRGGR
jgi:uncharacterized membrane protein YgcG